MNEDSIDPSSHKPQRIMEYQEEEDIISTMPDPIICDILSRLSIKEAARTSIQSTRWRDQWTNFSGILNFDSSLDTFELSRTNLVTPLRNCNIFISKWEKFMRNLELVLNSIDSPCLQGLRICHELGRPDKLVECFEFAAKKKVQILDLDFSFNFNKEFLLISEYTRNVLPLKKFEMKSLRILRLASVDVSGEVVEYLLEDCPSLETLFIKSSKTLERLNVQGNALRLKHLELIDCNIQDFSISAENLITFSYHGSYRNFRFENVPRLMKASFGGRYSSYLQTHLTNVDIFGLISQLEVLKLELSRWECVILFFHDLPEFNNVRHLELLIPHRSGAKIDRVVRLLGAFPSIRVLKLKFFRTLLANPEQQWEANLQREFPNLEELEVSGYKKDPSQLELLTKIIDRAPNLNKITVDSLHPRHAYRSPDVKARIRQLSHVAATCFAHGLKPYVPPPAELVVL